MSYNREDVSVHRENFLSAWGYIVLEHYFKKVCWILDGFALFVTI
jgi:hypothetical protein